MAGLGELRLGPTRLSEITLDLRGRRARAIYRAEGEGHAFGIHVGYVGGEAAELELGPDGWRPRPPGLLPRLSGLLSALAARGARPEAWIVRVEGENAVVSEISRRDGGEATVRLDLSEGATGWRLAPGSL